ncbi:MAG: hypothetical protein EA355_08865 [Rhodobacteraceae bacterium]|nr:MAG: hypothetical protein EA355_08865 [Paracoccaceae bacterium]
MLRRLSELLPIGFGVTAILGAIGGFAAIFLALDLAPPSRVVFAAGAPGSAYHAIAERYRAILAEDGIETVILETAGSVENAATFSRPDTPADVALLQGGVFPPEDAPPVEALAAVFIEPALVFHRGALPDDAGPTDWSGLRVAAGPEGSGTRAAFLGFHHVLGARPPDALVPLGGHMAAEALLAGDVEVAAFVAPLDAGYLAPLLSAEDVRIAPIRDVEALSRRLGHVTLVDIPPSALDYAERRPAERIVLPALTAQLVARADLHPALIDRLIAAARRIHDAPSILSDTLRFPSTEGLGLPANPQAAALVEAGPSPAARVLPYWAAAQINRIVVVLVPAVVVLLPLLRAMPGLYAWSVRKKVYGRYPDLIKIDAALDDARDAPTVARLRAELDALEQEARSIRVPAKYRDMSYTLQLHMDLVRRRMVDREEALLKPVAPAKAAEA